MSGTSDISPNMGKSSWYYVTVLSLGWLLLILLSFVSNGRITHSNSIDDFITKKSFVSSTNVLYEASHRRNAESMTESYIDDSYVVLSQEYNPPISRNPLLLQQYLSKLHESLSHHVRRYSSVLAYPWMKLLAIIRRVMNRKRRNTSDSTTSIPPTGNHSMALRDYSERQKRFKSDHELHSIQFDLTRFNLTTNQLNTIQTIYNLPTWQNLSLKRVCDEVSFQVTPFTIFQYYDAVDWAKTYHDKSIEKVIQDTILWRQSFNIRKIGLREDKALLRKGLAYLSPVTDKRKRSIMYLKLKNLDKSSPPEDYVHLIMNAVERADRLSIRTGSNCFVSIIDLEGFAFSMMPPKTWETVGVIINLLKFNYPGRLNAILVVNTGSAFTLLWSILKPLLPKKALTKIQVVGRKQTAKMLDEVIGLENVEIKYGGKISTPDFLEPQVRRNYCHDNSWEYKV